jgi:hypothetical protein
LSDSLAANSIGGFVECFPVSVKTLIIKKSKMISVLTFQKKFFILILNNYLKKLVQKSAKTTKNYAFFTQSKLFKITRHFFV